MPFARTAHRVAAAAVATFALLGLTAAGVVWRAGDADATAPTDAATVESSTTSTTTAPTTTVPPTTSTTAKPKPVTTTAAPAPTTVPRRAPATTAPPAPEPLPVTAPVRASASPVASAEERCAAALKWVGQHGLALPAGWGFRCPGQALENGVPRWGIACWNCEGAGSWIAIDVVRIGASDATLRYVIAHEICHAIDYVGLGTSTEVGADLCAALHGAPRQ
jgi:hypothetical protein